MQSVQSVELVELSAESVWLRLMHGLMIQKYVVALVVLLPYVLSVLLVLSMVPLGHVS